MKNFIDCKTWFLMNWYRPTSLKSVLIYIFGQDIVIFKVTSRCLPRSIDALLIIKLFKNSITAKKNKIVIISNLKAFDIRGWNNTFRIATISWIFGLNITNRSWYRKSTWEYTVGSYNHLNPRSIVWWRIRNIAFILINLASIFFNSFGLNFIFRLMIFWQKENFLTSINRHDGSAISYVCNIAKISNNKNNDCTRTTSLNEILLRSTLGMSPFQEYSFRFRYSIFNCYFRIPWEVVVSYNELM